jgi:hypothetical protein
MVWRLWRGSELGWVWGGDGGQVGLSWVGYVDSIFTLLFYSYFLFFCLFFAFSFFFVG